MKKRLLSFLLLMGLLSMSLTSGVYAKDIQALDLLTDFSQSLSDAGSVSLYMSMSMEMDISGEAITMDMEGAMSQVIRSETDIDMEMDFTTSMLGMEIPMKMYYKDGVYYQDSMDEKVKITMPIEEAMRQMNLGALTDMDMSGLGLSESAVISQDIVETDEGTEVYLVLDGSELGDIVGSLLGSMGDMLGDQPDLAFEDLEMVIYIDEEDVTRAIEMYFSMDMEMLGESASISYSIYMEILQIGDVEIEFPDDLDTYVEQDLTDGE